MTRPHLPPAPGVVRAVLCYQIGNTLMYSTYFAHNGGGWEPGSLAACASQIYNWERDTACRRRGDAVFLIGITITDLTTPDSGFYSMPITNPVQGNNTSPLVPENVTFALTAITGKRGTGRQGRSYWIGLTVEQVAGDVISLTDALQLVEDMRDLKVKLESVDGSQQVVLHRRRDGVVLNPAEWSPVIDWGFKDLTVDTQTNRLPGRSRPAHRR